jgi:hypothetical protein
MSPVVVSLGAEPDPSTCACVPWHGAHGDHVAHCAWALSAPAAEHARHVRAALRFYAAGYKGTHDGSLRADALRAFACREADRLADTRGAP